MTKKTFLFSLSLLLLGALVILVQPVVADPSPAQVVYQTPTAQPDGRVVYLVQEGDTCLRIQLLTGTTIDQLRTLNRLDQECTIIPGKELLLAVITPVATPTQNPAVSPTPLLPTPTSYAGNGRVCVLLFNDINGDAVRETDEPTIEGGAVSIANRLGSVSVTSNTTNALDPICQEVPEGEYSISMAIPGGFNATTNLNLPPLKVQAGDQVILEFGAQISTVVEATTVEEPEDNSGLFLAILGGLLIVMGIGLGIYIAVARRG